MKTRREFIKQVAMGAGLLALAPHGVASSNPKCLKEFYEDQVFHVCDKYTKEAEGAYGCLKNWFDYNRNFAKVNEDGTLSYAPMPMKVKRHYHQEGVHPKTGKRWVLDWDADETGKFRKNGW